MLFLPKFKVTFKTTRDKVVLTIFYYFVAQDTTEKSRFFS